MVFSMRSCCGRTGNTFDSFIYGSGYYVVAGNNTYSCGGYYSCAVVEICDETYEDGYDDCDCRRYYMDIDIDADTKF